MNCSTNLNLNIFSNFLNAFEKLEFYSCGEKFDFLHTEKDHDKWLRD